MTEPSQHFGRALRRWLEDDSPQGGWRWVVGGWTDGSCHLLAHTLHRWLGEQARLVTVVLPRYYPAIPQHLAVANHGWLIDGDGATREPTFRQRWQILADLHHREVPAASRRIEIVLFGAEHAAAAYEHGMCRSQVAVEGFAKHFVQTFGAAVDWGLAE